MKSLYSNISLTRFLESDIVKFSILTFALGFSLIPLFFGIDFTDTFFYLNLIPAYDTTPMVSASMYVWYLWTSIFGNSLFSVRVLVFIFKTLAILIPFFILIPVNKRKFYIYPLAFVFVLLPYPYSMLGTDVFTLFLGVLIVSVIIKAFDNTNLLKYIIFLSFLTALVFMARFPNLVVIPVILIFLFINRIRTQKLDFRDAFKDVGIYLLLFMLFLIALVILLHGSVSHYIDNLVYGFSHTAVDGSHSLRFLMKKNLVDFNKLILYIGVLFFIDNLIIIQTIINKAPRYIILGLGFCLFSFFIFYEIYGREYQWNLLLFFSALVIYYFIKRFLKDIKLLSFHSALLYATIILVAFMSAAGSNTALLKLSGALLCILPVILYRNSFHVDKHFFLFPFALVLIVAVGLSSLNPFEENKLYRLNTIIKSQPQLQYIRTSTFRAQFVENVMTDYNAVKDKSTVIFYGTKAHIFYYLTNQKPIFEATFTMDPTDPNQFKVLEGTIERSNCTLFLLTEYPTNDSSLSDSPPTPIEKMLLKHGYVLVQRQNYRIYTKLDL